jgi:hypothetical protein
MKECRRIKKFTDITINKDNTIPVKHIERTVTDKKLTKKTAG